MLIRRADIRDLNAIKEIRDPFILTPERLGRVKSAEEYSKNGYLLDEYPENIFIEDLNKIFIVAQSESKILGYVRIDNKIDDDFKKMDELGDILWNEADFKGIYYKYPHFELGAILVEKGAQRNKVGSTLLDYALAAILAEKDVLKRDDWLFSFVMVEPIKNESSLRFHRKNGFIKIAELKPTNLFGFQGYKSILMAKSIDRAKKWD